MTADRAALVEKVADLVRFNHDPIAIANEAVSLIRAETLEEAARVAEDTGWEPSMREVIYAGDFIAAAIRALKEDKT